MAGPALHVAARIATGWQRWRERGGRRRGLVPTVVPFVGYGGDGWVRILGRVVLRRPGRTPADQFTSVRGWRSFTSIPVAGAHVNVTAGTASGVVQADGRGILDERFAARLPPGWNPVHLAIEDSDAAELPAFIVDSSTTFGVVSDVDDTVMVTALPRPFLAAWNSFVINEHARTPVAGMAVLYERLARAHPGAPVIYLSTGSWNIVPALTRFLGRNLYPRGALLLTQWGLSAERWFRSGPAHKRVSLARVATEFPAIRWLLIGDDGQADERIYAEFTREHEQNVRAVAIRRLTPGQAVLAGGRSQDAGEHAGDPVPWVYASDGAGLSEQLEILGILRPPPRTEAAAP